MQTLLEICLSNAIIATVLALLAAGISRWRGRPAIVHLLWVLVLLKLITPPVMRLPTALPAFVQEAFAEPATGQTDIPSRASEEVDPELTSPTSAERDQADENRRIHFPEAWPASAAAGESPLRESRAEGETVLPAAALGWGIGSWLAWVPALWLAGSVLWFATASLRIWRFHRLLRFAEPAAERLQEQARCLAESLGLARCPSIWVVPGRISPLLWAVGSRVRLVLPVDLLDRLNADQQAALLAHELAHARRHDHWVRWLELLVIGVYWWHPVTWWARRELQQAEEQCCDAWVTWLLPAAAKAYAKALLQTVDFLDARPALPPVASGAGHVHLLKRRLTMIAREPFCPRLPWAVLVGAVLLALLVLPVGLQRLEAKTPAGLASDDEEQAPDTKAQKPPSRDLERRLDALEEKMERVLKALEAQRRGTDRRPGGPSAREATRQADETARLRRETEKRDREVQRRIEELTKEAQKRGKEAKKRAEEIAEDAKKRAKARAEESKRRIVIDASKAMDPEQMKELERQINEAVKETSERMKQLEKEIEETVKKSIDPERMKQLEKQIEETINKSINPERMEKLARQIEETVTKSLNAEQRERTRRAERPRVPEAPRAPRSPGKAPASSPTRDQRDLERRLERLEEKMEKVLQALEESRKRSN